MSITLDKPRITPTVETTLPDGTKITGLTAAETIELLRALA